MGTEFSLLNLYFSCVHFMFVCMFCIYFNEISYVFTDMTRYVTILSPGLGTH